VLVEGQHVILLALQVVFVKHSAYGISRATASKRRLLRFLDFLLLLHHCWWCCLCAYMQDPSQKRHLLRLQLVVPNLRPLPAAAFEELWGPMAADDRCALQLAALTDAAAAPQAEDFQGGGAAALPAAAAVAAAGSGVSAALAARFGGSGMGCIPLDSEIGNKLRG
jgi:hypothetical protein